ncbi:MAG: sugar ABC transporter permease [Hyphomicrobiales bacterium]|nr:MAG: sugar ABC transporter permease [Hyphomicrobiales bacterium]
MSSIRRPLQTAWLLVSPVQALLVLLILVPAVYIFILSFNRSSFGVSPEFVGFDNYIAVLSDGRFWKSALNTIIVVLIIVHVEILLAMGIALLFASGTPARALMLAAVLAPYAVSEVTAVVMWRFLFEPDIGLLSQALAFLGLPNLDWAVNPTHGLLMVSLLSIWLNLPFTFIILYSARLGIPGELYEAAQVDGASPWTRFRQITLPLLMPAILVAMLFRYIFAFRLFSEVWLLTGGGPARQTEVLAIYLYLEAFRYNDFGKASATGWLLVGLSLILALFYLRQLQKEMFNAR